MKKTIFFRYDIFNYISLLVDLLITKLLYPHARLIRHPFYRRGYSQIHLGCNLTTGRHCRIDALSITSDMNCRNTQKIVLGANVQIGDRVHLAAFDKLIIEDNVLIASNVFICDHDHGTSDMTSALLRPIERSLVCSAVRIGTSCWIGQNVCILKGVDLGHNSIVAAGAVVTSSFPPFSVVGGVPARIIKKIS